MEFVQLFISYFHYSAKHGIFWRKDFQQVAIIKQLVNHLSLDIQIKTINTVREKNGLAKSSRNTLLNEEQRKKASYIYESLKNQKTFRKIRLLDNKRSHYG